MMPGSGLSRGAWVLTAIASHLECGLEAQFTSDRFGIFQARWGSYLTSLGAVIATF